MMNIIQFVKNFSDKMIMDDITLVMMSDSVTGTSDTKDEIKRMWMVKV